MTGNNQIPGFKNNVKRTPAIRGLKAVMLLILGTVFFIQSSNCQGSQSFSTPGTFANGFTVPPGVTSITVQAWGGGGGGGIDATNNNGGPGGGGGAYVSSTFTVVSGAAYNVVVGAGR